ncbi:MAG: thiamine pyrophosphate-binding protein [Alphaproteobacteria bacterium]
MNDTRTGAVDWAADIFDVLREQQVAQVAHVPDAGHSNLLKACEADNEMRVVPLSTEEEGMALLAGAWLGGQRGVMLMQSSGVGNCINMLSLTATCRFPLLMLVTMRGSFGEFNPWQVPMGQATPNVLREMGCLIFEVDEPARVRETVSAAAQMTFNGPAACAVLLSQRLIGAKSFAK